MNKRIIIGILGTLFFAFNSTVAVAQEPTKPEETEIWEPTQLYLKFTGNKGKQLHTGFLQEKGGKNSKWQKKDSEKELSLF